MFILRFKAAILFCAAALSILIVVGCDEDSPPEPTIPKPTIVSFTANPSTVPVDGDSVKLTWQVNDATSLSISPGIGAVTPADNGAITIFVSTATVFTLTATNSAGNVTSEAEVNIIPRIVSFTANPSIVPANGDSVKLSWDVKGATSLSISSGVGAVTPTDIGSKTVFVSAATVFTLTATNSSGNATADAQVTIAPSITVNGFVKDADGEPLGATVIIKGKAPTTTGTGGNFSVSNVIVPYEIRLIISTGGQQSAVVYQGLTRPDPTLYFVNSPPPVNPPVAVISGTVPQSTNTTLVFFVSGDEAWSVIANQNGSYTINAVCKGSTTFYTGTLHVLRWERDPNNNNLPALYDGYWSKALSITAPGIYPGNNFDLSNIENPIEEYIDGNVIRPSSSYSITNRDLYLNIGNAYIEIAGAGAVADNFTYTVPKISGVTFEIHVKAISGPYTSEYYEKGIISGASGISITLATPPHLSTPVNNGTNIDTLTPFLWTPGSGMGVNLVTIVPNNPGPIIYLVTAGNTTTIPDLSLQGLGLPSNALYFWNTLQVFPFSSVDAAADDSFIELYNRNGGDVGFGQSETFNFITR